MVAIILHEYIKALTSYKLGDTAVKHQGRLSFSFKHVDILGFIFMMFFGYGWANPVRPKPFSYTDPRKGLVIFFLMPFLANIILGAMLAMTAYLFFTNFVLVAPTQFAIYTYWILLRAARFSFSFALFNILPIYPLNGIYFLGAFKPIWAAKVSAHEKLLQILLAFFIILGGAAMVFGPLVNNLMSAFNF